MKETMPEYVDVPYMGSSYRVYINTDIVCFKCHAKGHMQNKCPNISKTSTGTVNVSKTDSIPKNDKSPAEVPKSSGKPSPLPTEASSSTEASTSTGPKTSTFVSVTPATVITTTAEIHFSEKPVATTSVSTDSAHTNSDLSDTDTLVGEDDISVVKHAAVTGDNDSQISVNTEDVTTYDVPPTSPSQIIVDETGNVSSDDDEGEMDMECQTLSSELSKDSLSSSQAKQCNGSLSDIQKALEDSKYSRKTLEHLQKIQPDNKLLTLALLKIRKSPDASSAMKQKIGKLAVKLKSLLLLKN
jgi:hypothetical protein